MSDYIPIGIAVGTGIAEGEKLRAKKKAEEAEARQSDDEQTRKSDASDQG